MDVALIFLLVSFILLMGQLLLYFLERRMRKKSVEWVNVRRDAFRKQRKMYRQCITCGNADASERCTNSSGAIDGDMETGVCTGRVPEGRTENFDGRGRNYRFDIRDCLSCIYFVYGDEDCGVDTGCLYTGKKERIYNRMGEGCICDFYSPDDEQMGRENEQKEYDVKKYGNEI